LLADIVSPTSIRSRILKDQDVETSKLNEEVSPTSIRSRILKAGDEDASGGAEARFTHVDPFEDTERWFGHFSLFSAFLVSPTSIRSRILKVAGSPAALVAARRFTHVDPFENTERSIYNDALETLRCFTHVDPFEDTERKVALVAGARQRAFHPRRSVRGY